jgi:hypothetical protein
MDTGIVKKIQEITTTAAEIIVGMEPATPAEWDAMERIQAAHKQLRSIEIAELIDKPPRAGYTK